MFKNKYALLFAAIFILLLVVKCLTFTDPDFWWRIRDGEMFLRLGIPKLDPYSYTMPFFRFVDHAWLQSIIFYLGWKTSGKILLTLICSVLYFLTLKLSNNLINEKSQERLNGFFSKVFGRNLQEFGNVIFILGAFLLLSFFGIRVQVFSWFMFAVLLNVLLIPKISKKYFKFLPFLFLIWANFHGSFLDGLAVSAVIIGYRFLRGDKNRFFGLVVFVISVCTTLFNPYVIGLWQEVLTSVLDGSLRWSIIEWMPALFYPNFDMIILFTLSLLLVFKYMKRFRTEEIIVFLILLFESLSSRRNLPLWVIIAVPVLSQGFLFLYDEIKTNLAQKRFKTAYFYFFTICVIVGFLQAILELKSTFSFREGKYYPENAVLFLASKNYPGEIFSEYGWGGYLIYKLPQKKVFIDGRMPSWSNSSGDGGLKSAFKEYNKIIGGKVDVSSDFERFNIKVVLWPNYSKKSNFDRIVEFVIRIIGNNRFATDKKGFVSNLESLGWCRIYEDNSALIYFDKSLCSP